MTETDKTELKRIRKKVGTGLKKLKYKSGKRKWSDKQIKTAQDGLELKE